MDRDIKRDRFLQQLKILVCMYAGYGAMMVCRQMVTILSPALLADPSLGFTVQNLGDILAFGTLGAMVGKVVWGPMADKIGGRLTFLIGIVLTAILVTVFGLSHNVLAFTGFAALLYATKSSGWPAMTKLVGEWYHPQQYGRVWSILSTSSRASVVLGTLFFGWLLSIFDWRTVAFIASGIALVIYLICRLFLLDKPEQDDFLTLGTEPSADDEKAKEITQILADRVHHPLQHANLKQALWYFAKSLRVWLVVLMLMALTCIMAFLDFIPAFLMEVYHLTPSKAAMASSAMPLGSLIGLFLAIAWYDHFSTKGLRRILSIALVIAVICILTLQQLASFSLDPNQNFKLALGLIILFGAMTSPAYYIPMSVFSIEFGGKHSATLVCLIDMFGFAASASFGFAGGRLAASAGGWDSFINLLLIIGLIAALSCWAFMHAEYKASLNHR